MRRGEAGFTLIEVLVVLAILAIAGGIVLGRGPQRSAALEMRQATAVVAGALRVARTRAITGNRPVAVGFDTRAGTIQVAGEAVRPLPRGFAMAVTVVAGPAAGPAAITFLPDGSATGGQVELAGAGRSARVGVEWLTGRVRIDGG